MTEKTIQSPPALRLWLYPKIIERFMLVRSLPKIGPKAFAVIMFLIKKVMQEVESSRGVWLNSQGVESQITG